MRISDWSSDVCSSDLVLGLEACELLLELRPRDLAFLERFDLTVLGIGPVAVCRDELAFGQVAIDQPARVDAHGVARSVRVSVVIAAEQEGCPADQRDSADACEQGLLPLRELVVEVAPAHLTSARSEEHTSDIP